MKLESLRGSFFKTQVDASRNAVRAYDPRNWYRLWRIICPYLMRISKGVWMNCGRWMSSWAMLPAKLQKSETCVERKQAGQYSASVHAQSPICTSRPRMHSRSISQRYSLPIDAHWWMWPSDGFVRSPISLSDRLSPKDHFQFVFAIDSFWCTKVRISHHRQCHCCYHHPYHYPLNISYITSRKKFSISLTAQFRMVLWGDTLSSAEYG